MDLAHDEVTKRINHAAESILENERLTAGLDDKSAQTVIDWGLACAKAIMTNTVGLDDEEAEALTYPQLRATRRLMRSVSKWVVNLAEGDVEAAQNSFQKIINQAKTIYGNEIELPTTWAEATLSDAESGQTPQQIITTLRTAIEADRKPNEIY